MISILVRKSFAGAIVVDLDFETLFHRDWGAEYRHRAIALNDDFRIGAARPVGIGVVGVSAPIGAATTKV